MQFLIRNECPPGGFRFIHPHSGMKFSGQTLPQILRDIAAHNKANGFELMDVETLMCQQMNPPAGWCGEPPPPPDGSMPVIGVRDLFRGLETIANMVMDGGIKFVDQAEADRRAAICIDQCTGIHHIEHAACLGCSGFGAAVKSFANGFHAAREGELKACGVCKCDLKSKVLVSLDQVSNRGLEDQWPSWCWQKPVPEETPS